MTGQTFKALVVDESAPGVFDRQVKTRTLDELPKGDLLVRVHYSSLNYKDALSASGNRAVTRSYPHTPGIDVAGVVEESASDQFKLGDRVLVNNKNLGTVLPGGYGQYVRAKSDWAVRCPESLTLRESMIYGVAGFTAAYSILKLQQFISPDKGDILVTGATGGVGCMAVAMLKKEGYRVVASTGKEEEKQFLFDLGAAEVISREELKGTENALCQCRWAGVIDTVGGDILATAIKSTHSNGVVTCCGNVAAPELPLTVYPFILRGVNLMGVDCVSCPESIKHQIWQKIGGPWKLDHLEDMVTEVSLEQLSEKIDQILKGRIKGRVIVNLHA
ncbi:MAG: YhdH/YhfP family quinone oxidoreductase [Planctomycetota bacterium]|jgi:putative YhdH/YhfP family quinone oxidoreductase